MFETVGTHEDGDNPLKLLRGELTSTTTLLARRVPKTPIHRIREFVPLREVDIGLLEDKVGVLLKPLAHVSRIFVSWWRGWLLTRRPTPLMRVRAYMVFCSVDSVSSQFSSQNVESLHVLGAARVDRWCAITVGVGNWIGDTYFHQRWC